MKLFGIFVQRNNHPLNVHLFQNTEDEYFEETMPDTRGYESDPTDKTD